jgi:hypothetical protein
MSRKMRVLTRMRNRLLRKLRQVCAYNNDLELHIDVNTILFVHEGRKFTKLINIMSMK